MKRQTETRCPVHGTSVNGRVSSESNLLSDFEVSKLLFSTLPRIIDEFLFVLDFAVCRNQNYQLEHTKDYADLLI